jgi:hypothetical protein
MRIAIAFTLPASAGIAAQRKFAAGTGGTDLATCDLPSMLISRADFSFPPEVKRSADLN